MKKRMMAAVAFAAVLMMNGSVVGATEQEQTVGTEVTVSEETSEDITTDETAEAIDEMLEEADAQVAAVAEEETEENDILLTDVEEDVQISEYVFVQPDGKAYLCDENGERITKAGTPIIDGEKYYVALDGYLCKGWIYLSKWKMYFDETTYTAKTGFAEIDGKTYLFNKNGVMQNYAGTPIIDGKKYWFSLDNASLKTGWLYLGNWKMYFDPETFEAKTGMADINGKKYLFNEDGVMQAYAGTTVIDGKKYWFSLDDASLKTGWLRLGNMMLYFDPETYQAAVGLTEIEGSYYYFDKNGVMCCNTTIRIDYYDYTFGADGKLVSKEEISMIWPLPGHTYISSYFGYRNSPTAGASSYHQGIDIPAPAGTPILSCKSGVVTAAGYTSSRGYYVTIDHGNGISTCYMHMTKYAVSTGQSVSTGQVIGYVGTTGVSTGNHLHLSVIVNGVNRNPLDYVTIG